MTWKEVFQSTRGRWVIAFCLATLLVILFYMPIYYKEVIGPRKGILFSDPFLELFTPATWSLAIFIILYLSMIQTLLFYFNRPDVFMIALTTYCCVNLFRIFTMYALTLEPPAGMILLADPISSIAYPDKGFAKDLFFSGHVSTMMVLVLAERNRIAKFVKIIGTVTMGILLAWQHVHYTLDLLAAPVITYAIYYLVKKRLDFGDTSAYVN